MHFADVFEHALTHVAERDNGVNIIIECPVFFYQREAPLGVEQKSGKGLRRRYLQKIGNWCKLIVAVYGQKVNPSKAVKPKKLAPGLNEEIHSDSDGEQ